MLAISFSLYVCQYAFLLFLVLVLVLLLLVVVVVGWCVRVCVCVYVYGKTIKVHLVAAQQTNPRSNWLWWNIVVCAATVNKYMVCSNVASAST